MINVIPQTRHKLLYIEKTGYPDVLDFEWSTLEDTGYDLRIEVGQRLTALPKIWWIHHQSDSLLGYHKNFFAPDYLQTKSTVYSFATNNRHYYAGGSYVKKPGVTYLQQRVTEFQPYIQSWLLPRQTRNCNFQHRTYCSPHIGDLEYNMIQAAYTFN